MRKTNSRRAGAGLVSAACLAIVLAGCSLSHPDQLGGDAKWTASYTNIHDLTAHSDAAVAGSFTKEISHATDTNGITRTDFGFTVTKVLADKKASGLAAGSTITIQQTGGTDPDGKVFQLSEDPLFKIGDKSALFLKEFAPGHYAVIGGPNGRFNVRGGGSKVANGGDSVTPYNNLTAKFTGTVDQLATEVAKP